MSQASLSRMGAALPQPSPEPVRPGRLTRIVCLECAVTLTRDEAHHYGYHCHGCAVREHELILLWRDDPDHPDVADLHRGPVDLGLKVS